MLDQYNDQIIEKYKPFEKDIKMYCPFMWKQKWFRLLIKNIFIYSSAFMLAIIMEEKEKENDN